MYQANDYTYRVFWSEEDGEYVGVVSEFSRLSHLDSTPQKALDGIIEVVDSVLQDLAENGEDIPEPLSHRHYSGRIALRMTPEQHRRIAMEAAEQGVSINTLLVSRI